MTMMASLKRAAQSKKPDQTDEEKNGRHEAGDKDGVDENGAGDEDGASQGSANSEDYENYDYDDLFRMKIVGSRSDLCRKIKKGLLPPPDKSGPTMQARATWRKHRIHAALDNK